MLVSGGQSLRNPSLGPVRLSWSKMNISNIMRNIIHEGYKRGFSMFGCTDIPDIPDSYTVIHLIYSKCGGRKMQPFIHVLAPQKTFISTNLNVDRWPFRITSAWPFMESAPRIRSRSRMSAKISTTLACTAAVPSSACTCHRVAQR